MLFRSGREILGVLLSRWSNGKGPGVENSKRKDRAQNLLLKKLKFNGGWKVVFHVGTGEKGKSLDGWEE